MTSKSGEDRPTAPRRVSSELLSPTGADAGPVEEVSDVESFTRTRPDIDEDEELELPTAQPQPLKDAPTIQSGPPDVVLEGVEDDASVKTPDGAMSVQVLLI